MRTFILSSLLAIGVTGCGSGGGAATPSATPQTAQPETMVVQYDRNDDGEPDWVTLDTSSSPFRVIEAVHGAANGEPLDMTDVLLGTSIDPDLSQALADHLARSFDVNTRTELEVLLTEGGRIGVSILD